jgi:hypothetical protein
MTSCARLIIFAVLSIVWCAAPASAETMRCQSVNGNLNCAGSGGVSCQTIDGKKVCTSGHGDVVQSFGKGTSSTSSGKTVDEGSAADDDGQDDAAPAPKVHEHVEQRGPGAHTMTLDRNGPKLQLNTNRLSIQRD